ncbi:hypothetical protein RM531_08495 [Salinisphaera sp. P385]|uniref:Uncharacterized protein n=1 Tax=Spectribacter acetivorans TaxID=3075603 RepID=A0ABU3B914_9GAMM|nr:hypothetical protein [Salinisphaera sp. P385]MDT0618515.1 hypothetical protein [Salinisphaera sp. P385]
MEDAIYSLLERVLTYGALDPDAASRRRRRSAKAMWSSARSALGDFKIVVTKTSIKIVCEDDGYVSAIRMADIEPFTDNYRAAKLILHKIMFGQVDWLAGATDTDTVQWACRPKNAPCVAFVSLDERAMAGRSINLDVSDYRPISISPA